MTVIDTKERMEGQALAVEATKNVFDSRDDVEQDGPIPLLQVAIWRDGPGRGGETGGARPSVEGEGG